MITTVVCLAILILLYVALVVL
ncbi:hypothetical protein P756_gp57 [Mycobacterium phage PhrostyMug]|nr:hypothetical protein P756_gp57 [Mycobacterium phage PhrostyMug]YP_009043842.1 hypothetical protein PBI_PINTO_58 [Mycobacterium phage Pinto]AVO25480.1 hypothetical protein SEA_KYKAR_57 [Mycobacterium phage Kykar]AXH49555.1 hypothetical protein SEA_DRFEELGOOD_55 [Mycobacterium phage DrFeelGood]QGH80247.1 hypothetical protein SEA_KYMONKS1A_60 [Mycobacterium phage KyMonks1A]AGU92264.1 hypothetical protein PHROSTYMUG_57 [Mycobacterium phage PhrostyMug]AHZ95138.1 hypothetical protein PBI_PINTO_5